jgi:Spy/CpxP family protein refolding chaperone
MSKLSLIAALALGGLMACSTLATAQQDAPKKKGMTAEERLDAMTTKLDLKDDQKPKVKAALEATSKAMQDIRKDTSLDQQGRRDAMKPIMDKQNTEMKKILTPEQYTKYQEMNQRKGKKKTQ